MSQADRPESSTTSGPGPVPYKVTSEWDQGSLPAAIRNAHNTKPGVWGLLCVTHGSARLVFHFPPRAVHVTPEAPGVIPPEEIHHVELDGPVRLHVEFYKTHPLGEAS